VGGTFHQTTNFKSLCVPNGYSWNSLARKVNVTTCSDFHMMFIVLIFIVCMKGLCFCFRKRNEYVWHLLRELYG